MTVLEIKTAALDSAKAEVAKIEAEIASLPAEALSLEESVWNALKAFFGAV